MRRLAVGERASGNDGRQPHAVNVELVFSGGKVRAEVEARSRVMTFLRPSKKLAVDRRLFKDPGGRRAQAPPIHRARHGGGRGDGMGLGDRLLGIGALIDRPKSDRRELLPVGFEEGVGVLRIKASVISSSPTAKPASLRAD